MLTKAILAAGVALTATAASAVTITLDDFTTQFEVGSVAGPLVTDGAAVTSDAQVVGSGATRTGTLEVTGNGSPGTNFASLTSTGGQIQLSQDSSVDGQFTLTYNIGSILFDAYNTMSNPEDLGTLDVFVSNSDGNPRTLSLSLNGVVQDTTASAQFIDGSASFPAETQSLSFDPDELTGSDVFVFSFNPFENTDWTATFLEFNIEEVPPPPPTDVPAPAALGLLGMGLAGVGFSRRRRKTA
ncbi:MULTISPECIES: PEP-CTERM sorting domain-containing protein [Pacificimonas]|nr:MULTISPECIES: PEP-CTERM sorting domain-containing protein [Pacificimonas]MBZ6380036.1 PEP-CTERM sorting domain-containing protein [Pacificimonas aurantium]